LFRFDVIADAISRHIDIPIGMNAPIGDKAAISFATDFYDALLSRKDTLDAFKWGCCRLRLEGQPGYQVLLPKRQAPA